ncbi:RNA-binding protein [Heracleum sosnowskyi]|uniref:RNA-binding protein n=1 Tax=Heracleum sosnowskyi TaxID=360622 RepID=A0AAD8I5B9_9APIA|nr:RNA-binding protein [Heracleum sosnowskyi]
MASDSISKDEERPQQSDPSLSRNLSASRLNAKAAEFVPRSADPVPTFMYHKAPGSGYFHGQGHVRVAMQNQRGFTQQYVPVVQYHQQQQKQVIQQAVQGGSSKKSGGEVNKSEITDEAAQKVINQVEYYFSDVNLATTDHLMKFINKDPDGYVPISVVTSFKKIKAFVSSTSQLAGILRNSTKLVVSEDGKKVRRLLPLTDSDMEELQSRIVIAENLPEDHCHQNLMKIFSAVGSVKSIRTCQPQPSNGGSSSGSRAAKADGISYYSSKLHAFVEYESVEIAERAVTELSEEGTWRNGLKVRVLHKHAATSAQVRGKKGGQDGEVQRKEADTSAREEDPNEKHIEDPSQLSEGQSLHEHRGEEHANEKEGGRGKGRGRGRGKGRARPQHHNHNHNSNHRGNHVGGSSSVHPINSEHPTVFKQPPGPRMPDGTRGFSLGRGKPVAV